MRKGNFALRVQPSLLEEARKLAEAEGVAFNQLIASACINRVPHQSATVHSVRDSRCNCAMSRRCRPNLSS
jgi:hypothetical protein